MEKSLLIILLTFISLSTAIDSSNRHYDSHLNCSEFPSESRNVTCCENLEIFTDLTLEIYRKKCNDYYDQRNNDKLKNHPNPQRLDNCLNTYNIMETAGFISNEKFSVENFTSYVKNNSEIADKSETLRNYFLKCLNLTEVFKIRKIQEKEFGIKFDDCNVEPEFIWGCIYKHIRAVRLL